MRNTHSTHSTGLIKFLKTYAPDFCWCTAWDLFLIAEQKYENLEYYSFKVTLSGLRKKGVFKYKKDGARFARRVEGGPRGGLYLLKS